MLFQSLWDLIAQQIQGTLRHFLNGLGGALVADGYLTNDQSTAIVGGLMALAAVAWSWWEKNHSRNSRNAAVQTALTTPVVDQGAGLPADVKGLV